MAEGRCPPLYKQSDVKELRQHLVTLAKVVERLEHQSGFMIERVGKEFKFDQSSYEKARDIVCSGLLSFWNDIQAFSLPQASGKRRYKKVYSRN